MVYLTSEVFLKKISNFTYHFDVKILILHVGDTTVFVHDQRKPIVFNVTCFTLN